MSRGEQGAFDWIWHHSPAKGGARLVLLAYAFYADERDVSCPSLETLAWDANMSKRAIQDARAKLISEGDIEEVDGLSEYGTKRVRLLFRSRVPDSGVADTSPSPTNSATNSSTPPVERSSTTEEKDLVAGSATPVQETLEGDDVGRVLARLQRVVDVKGCALPSREAVATVLEAYPDRDALQVAGELAWWAEHGNGSGGRQVKNLAATFRNFMRQSDPAPASNGGSKYDRIVNA
jgi:hypothetical protein